MIMMQNVNEHEQDASSETLSQHCLGAIFPRLREKEFEALAKDIKEHGLLEEIVLFEGKVLDGWNRHLACRKAGVEPKYIDYAGGDPLGFVISRNIRRRQLTAGQLALAAARVSTLPIGSNQYYSHEGLPIGTAAKLFGIGERSVARAKVVLGKGIKGLIDAVESGQLKISHAAEIAEHSSDQQQAMQLNSWRMPSPQVTACTPVSESNALEKSGPVDQELDSAPGRQVPMADCSTDCQNEIPAAMKEALASCHEAPPAVPAGMLERTDSPSSSSRAALRHYDRFSSRWRKNNAGHWKALSPQLQVRFIAEELSYTVKT
jgi:hypothetical protein